MFLSDIDLVDLVDLLNHPASILQLGKCPLQQYLLYRARKSRSEHLDEAQVATSYQSVGQGRHTPNIQTHYIIKKIIRIMMEKMMKLSLSFLKRSV